VRGVVTGLVAFVLALPSSVLADGEPLLIGTVRADATIDVRRPNGDQVTSVPPGTYDFELRDEAVGHNFHLTGPPALDVRTDVALIETVVVQDVVLEPGRTYNFVCDPHADFMKGSFTTTASEPPPGPPPPGPPPPPPLPPAPPPPTVPPHVHPLHVSGVRISIARRGPTRFLVGRARIDGAALARLAFARGSRTRSSARKTWRPGVNTIRLRLPRVLPRGRWTALLQIGDHRFKRTIRFG
jgi:hypothetical protein